MSRITDDLDGHRLSQYKSLSEMDSRSRREGVSISIRKSRKDDFMNKRRQLADEASGSDALGAAGSGSGAASPALGVATATGTVYKPLMRPSATASVEELIAQIPLMAAALATADVSRNIDSARYFRQLLSIQNTPPIDEVVASGVVPRLVQLLDRYDVPALQLESAWALTNVAAGTSDQTAAVVAAGGIPKLAMLLRSESLDVREHAVWGLGNIAGDSTPNRDLVLSAGVAPHLAMLMNPAITRGNLLRNVTWLVNNLCRGSPPPRPDLVSPFLMPLCTLLYLSDETILTDVCTALHNLTSDLRNLDAVLRVGVASRMVELLASTDLSTPIMPTLRTLGNICCGSHLQTQQVLNAGALAPLLALLGSRSRSLRRETCWTLSNIAAGNTMQVDLLIQHNIMQPVVDLMRADEHDTQKEACWVICNALLNGTPSHVKYIVERAACLSPLVAMLDSPDVRVVTVVLKALTSILHVGVVEAGAGAPNKFVRDLHIANGVERIHALTMSPIETLRESAAFIIDNYLEPSGVAEEEEEAGLPPLLPGAFDASHPYQQQAAPAAHAHGAPQGPMLSMHVPQGHVFTGFGGK